MKSRRGTSLFRWLLAIVSLAAVTVVMLVFRTRLDKAHVALIYLLVVLGASAGGRAIGLAVGTTAFVLFDLLFLPPYLTLIVTDPLDWLVLIVFLITSVVAAELLERQRRNAELAESRRDELDQLSTLGAETLNAARAEHALAAIARVICTSVGVSRCEVFVISSSGFMQIIADASTVKPNEEESVVGSGGLLQYVIESGRSAIERTDRTVHVNEKTDGSSVVTDSPLRAFATPLSIRGQIVGALRISSPNTFSLSSDQQRTLSSLAYYAALGVDRLRLEKSEETAEELRRADRLKDALLAAVSHDLRTPLTTIKGIAHEISASGSAAKSDGAGIIEAEADRLSELVEGLLELSQLNAGAMPLHMELNTVDELIGVALQRTKTLLKDRQVDVQQVARDLLVGRFDFNHTVRIVVNLLENAAKYSDGTLPIRVAAVRRGNRLEISVTDSGIGIAESDQARIFEPFYRAPNSPTDVRGAGLGLAIAKRLAEAQDGELLVESRPGRGSTFKLLLNAGELPLV